MVRLQKLIAEAGLASRRAAERLILAGRVWVNGAPVIELGAKVDPETDLVTLDGQPVRPRRRLTVALNKPRDYVCSRAKQTPKQKIVGDLLPAEWQDLYPVGRLDRDSEGLLLLTNDGEFCLRLTHPRYGITKHYLATVAGKVDSSVLARLRAGVRDAGDHLRAQRAHLVSANASHSVVRLELTEGKQHEVRRLFAALGFEVERLQRTQIGPLKLGELRSGHWRVLAGPELAALRQVGAPGGGPAGGVGCTR